MSSLDERLGDLGAKLSKGLELVQSDKKTALLSNRGKYWNAIYITFLNSKNTFEFVHTSRSKSQILDTRRPQKAFWRVYARLDLRFASVSALFAVLPD